MKTRYRISREAEHDLDMIFVSVAEEASTRTAGRLIDRIVKCIATFAEFPNACYTCDDVAPGTRRVVAGNYLIYYRNRRGVIEVARVLHGRREQPSAFRTHSRLP